MIRSLSLFAALITLLGCSPSAQQATTEYQVLLRTNHAWDGSPYIRFPEGQPELTLLKISIPAYTVLDWHSHPIPNVGYLLTGELLVETANGHQQVRLHAGDALAEIVDGIHRSRTGHQPAELIVFYAGGSGLPLSEASPEKRDAREPVADALTALLDSIDERLDIAEAVALHKWDSGQAVHAQAREQQVIDGARRRAGEFGVSAQRASEVFADQIEANKLLQYSALARWHAEAQAPAATRLDLSTQLRPRLDHLQGELLAHLADFDRQRPQDCEAALAGAIAQREHSPQRTLALTRASGRLCRGN